MQYTTILTHQPGTLWQAFVPVLPDCQVQGATRNEVLDKIKTRIKDISLHMEVLQLQVSTQDEVVTIEPVEGGTSISTGSNDGGSEQLCEVKLNTDRDILTEAPWEWVGFFEDDPSWPKLFDEIEEQRDRHLVGGIVDDTE